MKDIAFCPLIIQQTLDVDQNGFGQVYTSERPILRVYQNVLSVSANHLRAYVYNIEKYIGQGNYKAQYLSQEEVDGILGR